MRIQSWLDSLKLVPTRWRTKPGRLHSPRHRLSVETLEDRSLPSFLAPVNYPAGSDTAAIVSGYFNNDTIPDLAAANAGASTVSVLLGNSDGTFQPARTAATGYYPQSVAVGDFNADGKLDLATANYGDVSVLLGNGDGTFLAPTNLYIGSSPRSVAVGDFNDDGKMDLGVTSNVYTSGGGGYYGWYPGYYSGVANVLLGNGTGSFPTTYSTWLGTGYHVSTAAADFNGDGRDDFATTNSEYGYAGVLPANSDGSLGSLAYFGAGYYPWAVAAGDVSGDGKSDLVTANLYGETVSVLLGNGLGGFGAASHYPTGGNPSSVVLGDFNDLRGDGRLDIATANWGNGLSVLLGRGDGTFLPPLNSAPGSSASGVAAGDFNGDGWLDAATASGSASVFVNDKTWPALTAPLIAITDATVAEGNAGTVGATFTVSLSAAYDQPVTVAYSTADWGATAGSDYQAASGTLTFGVGETSQTITVQVIGDRVPEWTESFAVRLADSTNAFLADATGVGTILDDEPTVGIADSVSKLEGDTGTTAFTFTVTLSAAYDAPVTVGYATADLTEDEQYWYGPGATAGVDYTAVSGTLTFAPGQTSQTITVLVNGDRVGEWDELFWFNLTSPSSTAHLGTSQVFGIIMNDEPYVSIDGGGTVVEGNTGTKSMTFTVTLSAPATAPVTVDFATVDGSATAGSDYTATAGTLTFALGETTKTIVVAINGDRLAEYDEYFSVNLVAAEGALINSGWGYGAIQDDEPRISINSPAPIKEGNSGTKTLSFTVTLSAAYDQPVTVRYATQDYTATAGSDYVATSGTLTFAAGETTKTIAVTINGDKKREPDESFYVVLSDASSNALLWNPYGWGTILNDDGPGKRN